jgi:hypothetical protein
MYYMVKHYINKKHKLSQIFSLSFFNLLISICCIFMSAAQDPAAVLAENAHYIETVLAILRHNACRQAQAEAASNPRTYLAISKNSPFSRWDRKGTNDLQSRMLVAEGTPQRMLKSILSTSAPTARCSSHQRNSGEAAAQSPEPAGRDDDGDGGTGRSRRGQGQSQAELCASHVLKERQRREKLNEKFIILRSLVPFVTKVHI